MSIEWLLTKTAGTDAQRIPNNFHNEDKLSGRIHSTKSMELNQAAVESEEERLRRAEFFSSANMLNRQSGINLKCSCGYTGIVKKSETDFKLLQTDKDCLAYFECPHCKRYLRYNPSTGTTKIEKSFWEILFGKIR